MRGVRLFKREMFKTCSGRWRWSVTIQGTSVDSGWATSQTTARQASLQSQERLAELYKTRSSDTFLGKT